MTDGRWGERGAAGGGVKATGGGGGETMSHSDAAGDDGRGSVREARYTSEKIA